MSSPSDTDDAVDIFKEPDGYYQQEKPATFLTHKFLDGRQINLRLVGHNPLWGHHLWNAGKTISAYIEAHASSLVHNKTILELGAGAGLPSLTAALHGANTVVATDYPDADLISNLAINAEACTALSPTASIHAAGLLWGAPADDVLSYIPSATPRGFDVLILADLLFNHSEHAKLVRTVCDTLRKSRDAKALVFFTPYRPWLLERDLTFFDVARDNGLKVEKVLETVMDKVMFEHDPGVSFPAGWRLLMLFLIEGFRMNFFDGRCLDTRSLGSSVTMGYDASSGILMASGLLYQLIFLHN